MSRIADHRAGYKTAILIAVVAAALMSQAPVSRPAPQRAEPLTAPAPPPRFDASVPLATDVRFPGNGGDGSAAPTF